MKTRKPDYAALISEFEGGDLSKSEFCRRFKVKFANFSYHLNRKRNSAFKEERFLPISILGPGSNAMIKISGAEIQYADGTILKLGESNFTLLKELLPVFQK